MMDVWIQVYDVPMGMMSEKLLQTMGNIIGEFVKSDPMNLIDGWKLYARIRVTMDVTKPLKRRMKVKREGGAWG